MGKLLGFAMLGIFCAASIAFGQDADVNDPPIPDAYWHEIDRLEAEIDAVHADSRSRTTENLVFISFLAAVVAVWGWAGNRSATRHQERVLKLVEREREQTDRMVKLLESIDAKLGGPT